MNKFFIIFIFIILSTSLYCQSEPRHSLEFQLGLLFTENLTMGGQVTHQDMVIILKVGYTFQYENGFLIGTAFPLIGYAINSNTALSFPFPSLLLGYGNKIDSFAFFVELRYLILTFSFEAGIYYKNAVMSGGCFFSAAPGIGGFRGYGFAGGYSINKNVDS